jgi:macrolide transport system ATP-binding/permease protein
MAWRAMAANKMRTLLTMLGIIIGIASVVSIVVVGDAAKQMVLADIRAIGTNTIDVYPGKDFGDDDPRYQQALKYDDLLAIQKQPWVRSATPAVSKTCACARTILTLPPARKGSGRSILMSTA